MAWDINEVYLNNGSLIGSSIDRLVGVDWGRYNVYIARFSSTVTNVTFRMDHSGVQGGLEGEPIAYVCDSMDDYEETYGIPSSYIDWFTIDSPRIVDVSGINTCYIVVRANNNTATGLAHMYLDIGGSGGNPFFTASGDSSSGTITVDIRNTGSLSYDSFTYYCTSVQSYTTSSAYHTFTGLSDGTYEISVLYTYNGNTYTIRSSSDNTSEFITLGGGGGGNWRYDEISSVIEPSGYTLKPVSLSSYEGEYFRVTFSSAGEAVVQVPSGANVDLFVTDGDYSYDPADGYPYASSGGSKASSSLTHRFYAVANTAYYIWIKGADSSVSGGLNVTIYPPSGSGNWSYTEIQSVMNPTASLLKPVALTSYNGQYFGVMFASSGEAIIEAPSSANVDMFVTDGYYDYDPGDGYPYVSYGGGKATSSHTHRITAVSGTLYYVWVKGTVSTVYGNIDIGISPPSTPSQRWTYTPVQGYTDPSSTVSRTYTLTAGNGFYLPVRFRYGGNAVFYSEGNYDDVGYLTSSARGYDPDTGVPYDLVDPNTGQDDDSGTGNNFRIEYSVSAGTTYYIWFRMYGASTAGDLTLYIVPPASSGGYVYIYTSSGWQRAMPYIYTSSGWKPAVPYIYTANGWKPAT